MDFERLSGDPKTLRRRNRGPWPGGRRAPAGVVLALVVILNLLGTVRTVVVPPSLNKTFWVTRDKASNEYLEQMGSFIAWLVLTSRPARSTGRRTSCSATSNRSVRRAKTRQEGRPNAAEAHQRHHRVRAPAARVQRGQASPSSSAAACAPGQRLRDRQRPQSLPGRLRHAGARMHLKIQGGAQCRHRMNPPSLVGPAPTDPRPDQASPAYASHRRARWAMSPRRHRRNGCRHGLTACRRMRCRSSEASDGVAVEAIVSIKEPTRIRIDGTPITGRFGNIHSSHCGIHIRLRPLSPPRRAEPAQPPGGGVSSAVNPAGEVIARVRPRQGRNLRSPGRRSCETDQPVRLVGERHLHAAAARADTPADTIVIRDRTPGRSQPQPFARPRRPDRHPPSHPRNEGAAGGDGVGPGPRRTSAVEEPTSHPAWAEARFTLRASTKAADLIGEKYLLQNVSNAPMVLAEPEFDRPTAVSAARSPARSSTTTCAPARPPAST